MGEEAGTSVASVMDPAAVLSLAEREELAPLGAEVKERMQRMLESVANDAA